MSNFDYLATLSEEEYELERMNLIRKFIHSAPKPKI